ncbi:MAG: DMT family transporter [Deltaproteobacteria bacterium]
MKDTLNQSEHIFDSYFKSLSVMVNQNINNQDFSFLAGILSAFLCILFGSNAVAIKLAFSGMGVFTTAAIRFSIASFAIYIWARATGRSLAFKKDQFFPLLILAALFAFQLSLFYLGLSKTNASRGTLIANLLPFWVLFLAHFFIPGDRISRWKFFGILLGFSGVVFMFAEKKGVTADFRAGDLIILSATFFWACSVIYLKRIIGAFSAVNITLYSMVFAVPLFLYIRFGKGSKPYRFRVQRFKVQRLRPLAAACRMPDTLLEFDDGSRDIIDRFRGFQKAFFEVIVFGLVNTFLYFLPYYFFVSDSHQQMQFNEGFFILF